MKLTCGDWELVVSVETWRAMDKLQRLKVRCIPNSALTGRQMFGAVRMVDERDAPQFVLWTLARVFQDMADALDRRSWGHEHSYAAINPAAEAVEVVEKGETVGEVSGGRP